MVSTGHLGAFLRDLVRGMALETLADQSDGQLVERALAGGNETALHAIVQRHGAMVFRVCWRTLQHEQDVEDAFQATFLVLARRLRSVRKHASLASWLHGVAHRVALKAKAQAATRRHHEHQLPVRSAVPPDDLTWRELRVVLDAELGKLAEKWRLPLVLCYLEGRTQEEAAKELGWSKTTLRKRLDEGRVALGRRLTGRGIVLPAALSAVLLSDCLTSAAPAPGLVAATVEAAGGVAAGKSVATAASTNVVALATGVLKTMFIAKFKIATLVCLILTLLGIGVGTLGHSPVAAEQGHAQPKAEKAATPRERDSVASTHIPADSPVDQARVDQVQVLPQGIDPETVAAYQKLGAVYGTIEADNGHVFFYPGPFEAAEGCLPGFRFQGKFLGAKLPDVSVSFGLEFHTGAITDAGMTALKDLNNLSVLSVRYPYRPGQRSQVTDRGLKQLAGLRKLTVLDLAGTNVTDDGLKELAGLNKLTILDLSGTRVTGVGLKEIKDLENLSRLHLTATPVTDEGLKGLAGFKKLAILDLQGTQVTDLKELAALQGLTELAVGDTKVTDAGLKELARLTNLATLSLAATQVTDAGLKELARVKNLAVLNLDETAVTNAGLKALAGLRKLTGLSLRQSRVSDGGLEGLAGLQDLSSLALCGTMVTNAGLKHLAACKNLSLLALRDTRVTDVGLKDLTVFLKLTELDLSGTRVTDAGLTELAGIKNLSTLHLANTGTTDSGVARVQHALPSCAIHR